MQGLMAPPGPVTHRPLMAPAEGASAHAWHGPHVELRRLLWTYAAVLAVIVLALQAD
ncbi:MAG TPA: hypothetical protein VFL60_06765 [Gaiellaceae bacterium]|nr:hypothetical protein [Gaiellaceae bacterium]